MTRFHPTKHHAKSFWFYRVEMACPAMVLTIFTEHCNLVREGFHDAIELHIEDHKARRLAFELARPPCDGCGKIPMDCSGLYEACERRNLRVGEDRRAAMTEIWKREAEATRTLLREQQKLGRLPHQDDMDSTLADA